MLEAIIGATIVGLMLQEAINLKIKGLLDFSSHF